MQLNVISPEMLERGPVDGVLTVYKYYGESPLQCLGRIRLKFPVLKNELLSYAGRLDPLAEGLMLVLVGKESNKNRAHFLGLSKQYELEVLFGLSTDTGDILGIIKQIDLNKINLNEKNVREAALSFIGRQHFDYPVFSSKTVQGKPLFKWAKENRLGEITIPKTDIFINNISFVYIKNVTINLFDKHLKKAIALVSGDFRQEQILSAWDEILIKKLSKNDEFLIFKIKVDCTSGSYMRTLAEQIGKAVGVPALAYSIKRTKIGNIDLCNRKSIIFLDKI